MKRVLLFCYAVLLSISPLISSAQEQRVAKPPILSLFDYFKVEQSVVKKIAPHFPWKEKADLKMYTTELHRWLEQHPDEWKALSGLEVFTKNGVGWTTYDIPDKYIEKPTTVNSSWYQWYQASGVTPAVKEKLFPHFPELDTSLKGDTLGINFERRVAIWERLYPKEYIAFLNTPELKRLNPFAPEKIEIQYMPRFLGAAITETAPELENTGDLLGDRFQYELRYRNWLFVFMPEKFDKLFGNDYNFPEGFDVEQYRNNYKTLINRWKDPDWGTGRQGK